jgi:GTP-binding protein
LPDFRSFVIADIPGIIEGAHRGRGLGHQFLRHIERTRTIAILIPVDDPEPTETYRQLCEELSKYSAELSRRPHCLVFTKSDLLAPGEDPPSILAEEALSTHVVSAVAHSGLRRLLEGLWARVQEERSHSDPVLAHPAERAEETTELGRSDRATGGASSKAEKAWWDQVDKEL